MSCLYSVLFLMYTFTLLVEFTPYTIQFNNGYVKLWTTTYGLLTWIEWYSRGRGHLCCGGGRGECCSCSRWRHCCRLHNCKK